MVLEGFSLKPALTPRVSWFWLFPLA